MSLWLIGAIALLTFASRALPLVAMPDPSPELKRILDRIPAPLFAALAAISLFENGQLVEGSTLGAVVGALALTPTRSLLWILLGGLGGFGVASVIL